MFVAATSWAPFSRPAGLMEEDRPDPRVGASRPLLQLLGANRSAARSRARAATSSRFRGVDVVLSESISRRAMTATSSTAQSKAASFAFDGALNPLSFRTNCTDAARISSSVAGGSKLNSVLIFRHIFNVMSGFVRHCPATERLDDRERHVDARGYTR